MGHYGSSNFENLYSSLWRIQRDFDWCYWWFNKTFLYCKAKITSSWYRTKSKAITRVKNTASHIPWLNTTWGQMVASNMIYCVLVLTTTIINKSFLYQVQTMLVYYLNANHPHIIKTNLFHWQLWRAVQNLVLILVYQLILVLVLNGCFLQQTIANLPEMALVE